MSKTKRRKEGRAQPRFCYRIYNQSIKAFETAPSLATKRYVRTRENLCVRAKAKKVSGLVGLRQTDF